MPENTVFLEAIKLIISKRFQGAGLQTWDSVESCLVQSINNAVII